MKKLSSEAALERMSAWLTELYGDRLQCLVAYGSVAGGNHHQRSDVNVLAVLDRIDAATLNQGAVAVNWWTQQGNPPIVMLTRAEQDASATLFPIEYLDIQANRRILKGADLFAQAGADAAVHRRQVEHELRSKLLRLRGAYMSVSRDAKAVERLMLDSASAFLTLFRHALVAVGEPLLLPKAQVLAAAAARFQFSAAPFSAVLDARTRSERLAGGKLEGLCAVFDQYLTAVQAVERGLENSNASSHVR